MVHATVAAPALQRPEAARRGLPIETLAPAGMLKARRKQRWPPAFLPDRTIVAMSQLKITQVRSTIGARWKQRESLRTLGLRRIR